MKAETKAEAAKLEDLWEQFKHRQRLGAIWLTTREMAGNLIPDWEAINQEDNNSKNLVLRYRGIISQESFPQDQLIKALKEAAIPALLARKGNRDFTDQDIESVLLEFIKRRGVVPEEGINEKTASVVRGRNGGTIDEWYERVLRRLEDEADASCDLRDTVSEALGEPTLSPSSVSSDFQGTDSDPGRVFEKSPRRPKTPAPNPRESISPPDRIPMTLTSALWGTDVALRRLKEESGRAFESTTAVLRRLEEVCIPLHRGDRSPRGIAAAQNSTRDAYVCLANEAKCVERGNPGNVFNMLLVLEQQINRYLENRIIKSRNFTLLISQFYVDTSEYYKYVTFDAYAVTISPMSIMVACTEASPSLSTTTNSPDVDLASFVITINHSSDPLPTPANSLADISGLQELMRWAKGRQEKLEAENRPRIAEVQALSDRLAEMDFRSIDRAEREEVVTVFNDLLRKAEAVVLFHDAKDEKTPWKQVNDISCILTSFASKGAIRFRGAGRSELSRKSSWPYGCKLVRRGDLDAELESLNFKI